MCCGGNIFLQELRVISVPDFRADKSFMGKRHTPVFLTQKEYDELLENVDLPFETVDEVAQFKPVGRVEHNRRKYKDRGDAKHSKSKEML